MKVVAFYLRGDGHQKRLALTINLLSTSQIKVLDDTTLRPFLIRLALQFYCGAFFSRRRLVSLITKTVAH
jgi:hypothetical protein